MAYPVLRHRIMTNFNAEAEGIKPDEIIRRLTRHHGRTLEKYEADRLWKTPSSI